MHHLAGMGDLKNVGNGDQPAVCRAGSEVDDGWACRTMPKEESRAGVRVVRTIKTASWLSLGEKGLLGRKLRDSADTS